MQDFFEANIISLKDFLDNVIQALPGIALAAAILIACILTVRFLRPLLREKLGKIFSNETLGSFSASFISALIILAGLAGCLSALDLDGVLKTALAGAGIAGLAIGLALQAPLTNLFSGISISLRKYISVGDLIHFRGELGNIQNIDVSTTTIKKLDGGILVVPNKILAEEIFENLSKATFRRVKIECGIDYDANLHLVKESILDRLIHDFKDWLKPEEINFHYHAFGPSSIDFTVFLLVPQPPKSNTPGVLEVKSRAIISIKKCLDDINVGIPYPIRTIIMDPPVKTDKPSEKKPPATQGKAVSPGKPRSIKIPKPAPVLNNNTKAS